MNIKNAAKTRVTNIATWHVHGYTGIGVNIITGEGWNLNDYSGFGRCSHPILTGSNTNHGECVARVLHEFAPDANITYLPFAIPKHTKESFSYMKDESTCVLTYSKRAIKGKSGWLKQLPNVTDGLVPFVSAGNTSNIAKNFTATDPNVLSVAAARIKADGVHYTSYTNRQHGIDFAGLTDVYISDDKIFPGTSCAAPMLAGLCACVQQLFIEKTCSPLGLVNMTKFLADYSKRPIIDMHIRRCSTHGYIILPHPDAVDLSRYVP